MKRTGAKILGFTGTFAAGKGTVIDILCEEYGAAKFSLSEEIRDECRREGLGVGRENLLMMGNGMRKKYGDGYWASRVAEHVRREYAGEAIICVDSIRAPGEVEELRRQFGNEFRLVAVDAPVETRYGRIKARKRAGEEMLSLEQFKESEEREQSHRDGEANIKKTMELADVVIINSGTLPELKSDMDEFLAKIGARNAKKETARNA